GGGPATPLLAFGGAFPQVGNFPAARVAAWDPATAQWIAPGAGIDGTVNALLALPNGDLIAGGLFSSAGGGAVNNLARWDGSAWWPLGLGTSGEVFALALHNGDVVAGGSFANAGGVPSR